MGGIIDFDTPCPWELYLFAFMNIGGAIVMYLFDACRLLTSVACTDAETVYQNITALSLLYVGVIFTVLTYHAKHSPAKVTRLSNIGLLCSMALLVSVVFIGNASFGGLERSWMHKGDLLTALIVVFVLSLRVSRVDAEWAQKHPINEGMGINCKTLLVIFLALTLIKFIAMTDFIGPTKMLADGSDMTAFAMWMWSFMDVMILEALLAILYSVLFDDDAGHELLVITLMVMSAVAMVSISSVQKYMSGWMGLNSNAIWIRLGVILLVCAGAIVGGRRGQSDRSGYQNLVT